MRTEKEIRDVSKRFSVESSCLGEAIVAAVLEWVLGEQPDLDKAVQSALGEDEEDNYYVVK